MIVTVLTSHLKQVSYQHMQGIKYQVYVSLNLIVSSLATGIPCFLLSGMYQENNIMYLLISYCCRYGAIADSCGRKAVILAPVIGAFLYIGSILIIDIWEPSSYIYIYSIGSLLMGLSGYYPIYIMGIFAYTADCTEHNPQSRRTAYSIAEGCMFIPSIFGPILAGLLAFYYGFSIPLLLILSISVFTMMWIIFMPESLAIDSICRSIPLRLNLIQTWENMTLLYTIKPKLTSIYGRSPIPYIVNAFILYYFVYCGFNNIYYVYVKHKFSWSADLIGYYEGKNVFLCMCAYDAVEDTA